MLHLLLAFAPLVQSEGQSDPPPPAEERGLVAATDRACPGYTLISPLRSQNVYLLDVAGEVVHEWKTDAPPGQTATLDERGRLLRAERVGNPRFSGGGQGGRVREYDWDGNVTWEYVCSDETRCQHHEAELLPNGNVLLIAWEAKSGKEAFEAGRDTEKIQGDEIWPDMLLEIEPTRPSGGKIVWEWHAWDHLVQERSPKKPGYGKVAEHPERIDVNAGGRPPRSSEEERKELEHLRGIGYVGDDPADADDEKDEDAGPRRRGGPGGRDWMHGNAVDYDAELDLILLSVHEFSEVWVIDHSTTTAESKGSKGGRLGHGGDLVMRWGNPRMHAAGAAEAQVLFGQHDAQWLATGSPSARHVLVFNNGQGSPSGSSSVDEFALDLSPTALEHHRAPERVWTYASDAIDSGHISGAQRLSNGDTLICNGEAGRVVEVTPEGEVVWNYLNPHGGDARMGPPGGPGGPPGAPGRSPRGEGADDERGDRRGPPPGGDRGRGRSGPGGGRRGPGGDSHSLFRATHYAPDHPGIAAHLAQGD